MNHNCTDPKTQQTVEYGKMLTIDKTFLSDSRLSWAAKGYFTYLQTKGIKEFDTDKLRLSSEEMSLVQGLIQCGYLQINKAEG